jgi:competence protein ComEC
LVTGLLKTPLRWSGIVLAIVAVIWAARTPKPDVLVGNDGRTFAVRGADGRLAFHHTGGDTFATREWLAADADGRDVRDPSLGSGITCDPMAGSSRTRLRPTRWRRIVSAPPSS